MKVAEKISLSRNCQNTKTKKLQWISTPNLHTYDKVSGKELTGLCLIQFYPVFLVMAYINPLFFHVNSFYIISLIILKPSEYEKM